MLCRQFLLCFCIFSNESGEGAIGQPRLQKGFYFVPAFQLAGQDQLGR